MGGDSPPSRDHLGWLRRTAWWRSEEDRRRREFAQARSEALLRQQADAAAIAQGRAESVAAQRHREMVAATVANKPRPGFLENIPSAWLLAAGITAYKAWKRRPSEIVVGYRRG